MLTSKIQAAKDDGEEIQEADSSVTLGLWSDLVLTLYSIPGLMFDLQQRKQAM